MSVNYAALPSSLKEIKTNLFYTLDYSVDYRLDKFQKTGADSYRIYRRTPDASEELAATVTGGSTLR